MFVIDKFILDFLTKLFTSSYTQFMTLLTIFLALQVILPEKKK